MAWTLVIDVWDVIDERSTAKRIETEERFDSISEAEKRKKEIENQGYEEYQPNDIIKVWLNEIG